MAIRKKRVVDKALIKVLNPEYDAAVANFERILSAMYTVSNAASGRKVDPKRGWASVLFTRLCTVSTSLKKVIQKLALSEYESDYWDYSSVAILTRSILECCLLFYYLGVEDISEAEWRDRLNLIHLHDCTARISLFRNMLHDEEEARKLEGEREKLLKPFEHSELLASKPEKQRRHLLRGDKMMFAIQDDILEAMGLDKAFFRAWYEVLSSHVHNYPFSFHRMVVDGRGDGVENDVEKLWITESLSYLSNFLARSLTQMLQLFPDIQDPRLVTREPRGAF